MPTIKKTKVEYEGRVEEREVIVEKEVVSPWEQDARLTVVGQATPRVDGAARVTGEARYTHDVRLPGMLVGRFLRSPYPHARIKRIDSSRAEQMPGVWLVWHHDQPPPLDITGDFDKLDSEKLFPAELAYEGKEVAFLVAENERLADDALAAIEVEYEELPFVTNEEAATEEDAPPVHDAVDANMMSNVKTYERGDTEAGLDEADVTVTVNFTTPIAAHCCMETHGSVAVWEDDELTVYHSTQGVFSARSSTAKALGLPLEKVRVICEFMGGGFGSKGGAEPYTLLAAQAAQKLRRPVRAILDRREEQLAAGFRPGSRQRVQLGARRDGTLTAIVHEAWVITGAYGGAVASPDGPSKDLYACPNVRTAVRGVRISTDSGRAFRAPGYVEGAVALEGALDELARALEMDPLELRLKNYAEDSPQRGVPYTAKHLREAYERGAELIGWYDREERRGQDGDHPGLWRRGWGVASQIWGGGGGPPANALVKLLPDGTAEVMAGVQDIGTGTRTIVAQVAAEELGLPLESVRCVMGDTLPTPYGPHSGGSVTLASITPAVRNAAREALRGIFELAAIMLEVPDADPDDFEVRDGEVYYTPDESKHLPYLDVADKMGNYMIVRKGARGPNPEKKAVNTFGAQFAEVDVNVETGEVRVRRVVAVHDVGRIINPMTAASQVYGGVLQGMGMGTIEERVLDERTGLQLTPNLEDYKVPTIADIPEIAVDFVDVADPEANSVGSRGLGEPPIVPAAAVVANAVADALGVRVTDLPITPDRVLRALDKAGKEEA